MRPLRLLAATALLAAFSIFATIALGAATGNLKLDVLGDDGAGAKNPAHLIAANGKEAGQVTVLTLGEVVKAELWVQTVMSKLPFDNSTRVVVLRAGTQTKVDESAPGSEHRFKLDPGDYDIYVENHSGKGKPYATAAGIHLESGAKVEPTVPLD